VLRTKFYNPEIHHREIHIPVLKAIGLESHGAFEKAVHAARRLPRDVSPSSVVLQRTGEWSIEGQTTEKTGSDVG
jgi:hypothetical protein